MASTGFKTNGAGDNWDALYRRKSTVFSQGGLWSWGHNAYGQLGDGSATARSSPVQIISGGTNWKQIMTNYNTIAGIKSDGTLWMWGAGFQGQLGDGTQTPKNSPVQTLAGGTNWKMARGGWEHTVAIKTDGTLWAWGHNNDGQLGDGTQVHRSSPIQIVTAGQGWKYICTSGRHTAAINQNGFMWLWGNNGFGRLGDNTQTNRSSPVQLIATAANWKMVSCGFYHTSAIQSDGTLWGWGNNGSGRLGDGTTQNRSSPIQTVAGGNDWKQVASGIKHTAAIKTDATLWAWGFNGTGQLGNGNIVDNSSPVLVPGNNWRVVAAGSYHTVALKGDGRIWAWGHNSSGQLGDGTSVMKSSPVQILNSSSGWTSITAAFNGVTAVREDLY